MRRKRACNGPDLLDVGRWMCTAGAPSDATIEPMQHDGYGFVAQRASDDVCEHERPMLHSKGSECEILGSKQRTQRSHFCT